MYLTLNKKANPSYLGVMKHMFPHKSVDRVKHLA